MDIQPNFTPFAAEDNHLVRRLAFALILQWNLVPTDVRQRILDQAGMIADGDDETVQLREQLNALILKFAPPADA